MSLRYPGIRAWILAFLLSTSPVLFGRVSRPLVSDQTLVLFQEELSGELAKDHVAAITRYHRIQGSRGYSEAAQYVLDTLRSSGFTFEDSWVESFRSDGKTQYQTWQSPSGWSIRSAELRMIAPTDESIVRFPDIPMSVMTYSNAGRARGDLVDVGAGTSDADYEGKDVSGRWVLATGYGGDVHRLAVLKYGAAAIVCFPDDQRGNDHPDLVQYTGIWPRSEEIPRVRFGFNISNRKGREMRRLLARGQRIVLDGKVEGTGLEPGRMDVIVARITGSERPDEELILAAHLDHPKASANDNASGSAALMDVARALRRMIRTGRVAPPKRTIRFLWVPEFYGTMAYIDSHPEIRGPELGGKFLGALNLDMAGEDTDLLQSRLNITWTPASISSILTDVTENVAWSLDRLESSSERPVRSSFNYRVVPFSGGSDHVVFNDGAVRVPAMMLGHWPDYTHHTSEDTLDKVDPGELERVELIATASIWYLASLDEAQSLDVVNLVAANGQTRLIHDTSKAVSWLLSVGQNDLQDVYADGKRVIDFALRREQTTLQNVLDFAPYELTRKLVQTWMQGLEGQAELQRRTLHAIFYQRAGRFAMPETSGDAAESRRKIPERLTRGPLAPGLPEALLTEERRAWYATEAAGRLDRYLFLNLIDGTRSVLDIRNDLTAATRPVSLEAVERFLEDLERAGLIEMRQSE